MTSMEIISLMKISSLMEIMPLMVLMFMTSFPLTPLMDALLLFADSLNLLSLYAKITTHMQAACGGITEEILQPVIP
jgi:hypothetical protein